MATTTDRESTNPSTFKVVGTNPIRHDGGRAGNKRFMILRTGV